MPKKEKPELYEKYPFKNVLIYNFVTLSLYAVGIYLTYLVWKWAALIFFIYLIFIELSVYKSGCSCCYYYGKRCVAGRGKIAPLIVKRKDPKKFCERTLSFKDFIPTLLVALIPVAAGIYLLIKDFNFLILGLTLWPLLVNFIGNPIVYGKIACPHCKQGAKCCPACEYFNKKLEKEK